MLVGRLMHKDREKDRDLGLNGVCLSWRADVAPNKSEVDPEGKAIWSYIFRIDNPGRFPISDVEARVTFPLPVARIRHNRVIDDADPVLRLEHPVLPGGGSHEWKPRRLRMTYDEAAAATRSAQRSSSSTPTGSRARPSGRGRNALREAGCLGRRTNAEVRGGQRKTNLRDGHPSETVVGRVGDRSSHCPVRTGGRSACQSILDSS